MGALDGCSETGESPQLKNNMNNVLRLSGWLLVSVLVVIVAIADVTWMAGRIIAYRAAHAHLAHRAPGKIINLPLTGLK